MSLKSRTRTPPTMPSTTTTTTHSFDRHDQSASTPDHHHSSSDCTTWPESNIHNNTSNNDNITNNNGPSTIPFNVNALDLWLEQATSNNTGNPINQQPQQPQQQPSLVDIISNADPNLSLDLKVELDPTTTNNNINPFASNFNSNNSNNNNNNNNNNTTTTTITTTTPVTASSTPTPPAVRPQKKQRTRRTNNDNSVSRTKNEQSNNSPVTSAAEILARSSPDLIAKNASVPVTGNNSPTTQSDSTTNNNNNNNNNMTNLLPLESTGLATSPEQQHQQQQEEEAMAAVNALASHAASHDGLSAVERCKRSAEEFTMSQLAKRKRKATSPPSSLQQQQSSSDDGSGERQSHRKYQKRLQKNRDSAFVSRIRRREYTRILENSLSTVEKEKDAAVAAFREMKRRFDVVSAELAGIKTAAASNFAGIRDALINRVTVPDTTPAGLFMPPAQVGFHPGQVHVSKHTYNNPSNNMQSNEAFYQNMNANQQQSFQMYTQLHAGQVREKPKPYMTTMYMVALVVGVLIPDFTSRRWSGAQTPVSSTVRNITGVMTNSTSEHILASDSTSPSTITNENNQGEEKEAKVWTQEQVNQGEQLIAQADSSMGAAKRLVDSVGQDAIERLGDSNAQRAMEAVQRHLQSLNAGDVEEIETLMHNDNHYSGFEALLRAVISDDGSQVEDEVELDQIIKQVADLNFEDRL